MTTAAPDINGRKIHVGQGCFEVAGEPDAVFTTILGSCVAACLFDPVAARGGMNHFLLPAASGASAQDQRYGVNAMELLINSLLKAGARRDRLQAKVFGGARMNARLEDIGAQNADFVRRFLGTEGICIVGESLGGDMARRIHFWPSTGRARQYLVKASDPRSAEILRPPPRPPEPAVDCGELELF